MKALHLLKWNFFACSGRRAVASEPFFLNPSTPALCGYSFNEQRSIAMGMLAVRGPLKSVSFCPRQGHWMTLLNLCPLFLEILSRPRIQLFQRAESSESRLQQLCSVCWGRDPLVSFRKMKKARGKESIWSPCLCGCCLCPILLFRWPHESITHSYWGYNFCFDFPFLFSMQCFPLNSVADPNWRQCGGPVSFRVATAVCFELWPSRCYVAPLESSDGCNCWNCASQDTAVLYSCRTEKLFFSRASLVREGFQMSPLWCDQQLALRFWSVFVLCMWR